MPPTRAARSAAWPHPRLPARATSRPEGSVVKAPRSTRVGRRRRRLSPSRARAGVHPEATAIAAIKGSAASRSRRTTCSCCRRAGRSAPDGGDLPAHLRAQVHPVGQAGRRVTDARFSGVSTGACIGHVGPEALAGGPIGAARRRRDRDRDRPRTRSTGRVNLVGAGGRGSTHGGARACSLRARATGPRPPTRAARRHPALGARCRRRAAAPGAAASTTSRRSRACSRPTRWPHSRSTRSREAAGKAPVTAPTTLPGLSRTLPRCLRVRGTERPW